MNMTMHERSGLPTRAAGSLLLAACLVAWGPAHADGVSVKEGETAQFRITATPKHTGGTPVRIRVWYDTDGGTAVEGRDYETAHSWSHNVQGVAGSPLTITVKTFADAAAEGDETFGIRLRRVEVRTRGRWGHDVWRVTPVSGWTFSGVRTATIRDTTPRQHSSYEAEKYGQGYTGEVWGE